MFIRSGSGSVQHVTYSSGQWGNVVAENITFGVKLANQIGTFFTRDSNGQSIQIGHISRSSSGNWSRQFIGSIRAPTIETNVFKLPSGKSAFIGFSYSNKTNTQQGMLFSGFGFDFFSVIDNQL